MLLYGEVAYHAHQGSASNPTERKRLVADLAAFDASLRS